MRPRPTIMAVTAVSLKAWRVGWITAGVFIFAYASLLARNGLGPSMAFCPFLGAEQWLCQHITS